MRPSSEGTRGSKDAGVRHAMAGLANVVNPVAAIPAMKLLLTLLIESVATWSPIGTCRLSSRVSFRFLQGFEKDVTVAGGESDATQGGEGRGNVGGSHGLKIVTGLN